MHVACLNCGKRYEREPVQARIADARARGGGKAPRCEECGGLLKPATVSFGQSMPERETAEVYKRSAASDLFIVVGSSLVVHPAASMPVTAKRAGATLVIVNRDETACDGIADMVFRGEAGPTMAAILDQVRKIIRKA